MTPKTGNRFNQLAGNVMNIKIIWFFTGMIFLLVTFLLGKASVILVFLSGAGIIILEFLFEFRKKCAPNPYFMMAFSPLLLIHYSTIGDFNIRTLCFLILIYITNLAGTQPVSIKKIQFPPLKPLTIWFISFLIFSTAPVIIYIQGVQLSGDEPHYLMVTQSIIEDGDFNLENNFKDKTYYKYLPVDIQFHGKILNGQYVSYHMPGVSFLLLPFYALFNLLGGLIAPALYFRLVASLINSFFALALYTILKIQFPENKITGIWILFLCLFPLIFHSSHLYPELPAATLMMGAFIFAYGQRKIYWLSGLLLSLVAWFHVKYYPSMAILALFIVIQIMKEKKPKQVFIFFIFPVLNFILLTVFCQTIYDTFNPANIFPGQNYFNIPVMLRIKVFLAYFLDQRDGLLFYSPIFFLFLFGFKKRLINQNILAWTGLSYIIFHAFTTVRGAYSPAGRPLIFVSWIFLILIANFYFKYGRDKLQYGFKLLTGMSFFTLFWLFYYPFFIYQPVFSHTSQRASNLLLFLGSSTIKLWKLFPSFLTHPQAGHPANVIWIIGLIVLILFFYLNILRFNHFIKHQKKIGFGFFILSFYLLCLFPHVHLISENRYTSDKINFFNNSKNFRFIEQKDGFNILAGQTYKIFLEPKPRQKPITMTFRNTDQVDVVIYNKTTRLFDSRDQKIQQVSMKPSNLKSLKIKKKTVIPLEIKTHTREKQAFLLMKIH